MQRVGLAILGCGYMGGSGVLAFANLANTLPAEGIYPELILVLEPYLEPFQILSRYCFDEPKFTCVPTCYKGWMHASTHLIRVASREKMPIVVYDAARATDRIGYLSTLHDSGERNFYYIGEKPIVADPAGLNAIEGLSRDFPVFCEFIESENPIFHRVRRYIAEEDLEIRRLWFWRSGSSGIKKLIASDRDAIRGGALPDKSPHDFSLSLNLLGPAGVSAVEVDAETQVLIPHHEWVLRGNKSLLDASNESIVGNIPLDLESRVTLPADGLTTCSVRWNSPAYGIVPARYVFSWIGLTGHPSEAEFQQKLNELGIGPDSYVLEHSLEGPCREPHPLAADDRTVFTTTRQWSARIQEVRVGIIECADRTIVCNFLTKKTGPVQRFVRVIFKDGRTEVLDDVADPRVKGAGKELKARELSQVFEAVIKQAVGLQPAQFIDRHVTLEVHRVMFRAQDEATKKLSVSPRTFEQYFEEAVSVTQNKIRHLSGAAAK